MDVIKFKEPLGRTVKIRGHMVKAMRLDREWSVAEFAKRARRSEKSIKQIESKEFKNVYMNTILAIAKAFGVNYHELIHNGDEPNQPPQVNPKDEADRENKIIVVAFRLRDFDESSLAEIVRKIKYDCNRAKKAASRAA